MSGSLFIIAAPSGGGKSSLVSALLKQDAGIVLSVSCTTRAPRLGEVNGREYHFISVDDFMARRERGEFLESAQVHDNWYATSKTVIAEGTQAGQDVLLEIDCQGAEQVKQVFPDAVAIFILPPSEEELARRLQGRGTDSAQVIATRIANSRGEMREATKFDYVIINRTFSEALDDISAVVKASRLRLSQVAQRESALFTQLGIS
jgi:guanylate kinase